MMDLRSLAYDLCRGYVLDQKGLVDESVLNQVHGWIRARDLKRLCSASDYIPQAYSCEVLCRFCRQVSAFFKKNPAFAEAAVCESAAHFSFERAERICRITNKRLDYYWFHKDRLSPKLERTLSKAESIVNDTLGDFADFIKVLPMKIRVTNGATATRSRRESFPHRKVRFRHLPATASAVKWLRYCARSYGQDRVSFSITDSNRVETVPKNWKTDRTIACEPEGNLFLQLAFDTFVKDRLRVKLSIDLSDQSANQRLAVKGSTDGSYATIDFSMASDTVSLNSVAWLFPHSWASWLRDVRSPKGLGFGQQYNYAKLSSMGNGATFAVETLIFAALCKAVGSKAYKVYGDDVVIETEFAEDFISVAKFLGFQVNLQKSYVTGPFRESCGVDCYLGVDVTPFYLRAKSSMKVELCHLVNGLAPLSFPSGNLATKLLDLVKEHKLPLIPWNWSSTSGVWITPHDAYGQKLIRTRGWVLKVLALTPKTRKLSITDSRTLFLWHLNAVRRSNGDPVLKQRHLSSLYERTGLYDAPTGSIICSSVPIFTHKYTRRWVCWLPPAEATPGHLYWWSDLLIRCKAG